METSRPEPTVNRVKIGFRHLTRMFVGIDLWCVTDQKGKMKVLGTRLPYEEAMALALKMEK